MNTDPAVPVPVRDAVYIGGAIVGGLTVLAAGVVGVWWPELKENVDATAVYVSGFITFIVGGIATAYRPGASR